jgi:very-short-patch-repair endonuclease
VPGARHLTGPQTQKLDELAAAQWGVVSVADLHRCGLDDNAIAVRVRRGDLHRLHRGVYAVGHPNVPLHGRFLAAVKACGPTAALSHFSAAALHGFLTWDDRHPEVTTTKGRRHPGIRVHRTTKRKDTTRKEGIRATTPAQTLHDLSSMPQFKALRRATRQARALGLITPAEARSIAPAGHIPTRSELEDAVLDLIAEGSLQPPDVNVPVTIAGRRIIPDFRWPAQRLVIEADGAAWHDERIAREDDAERQAILEAAGERVVRVTWEQAVHHRAQTLARLTAASAPKLPGT